MTRIWYCSTCGYEVTSRGRCHSCRQRLVASALPQLDGGSDDDEVGYRLDGWVDRDRGRLIGQLNAQEILHRFEGDELVVDAEDEERVDDLVALVSIPGDVDETAGAPGSLIGDDGERARGPDEDDTDGVASYAADVVLLADAARRLHHDPTDMLADGDVAEASTAVFVSDHFSTMDEDTWAAVGRVTRRLLAVLGADEALEDQIRMEAGVLAKLLEPVAPPRGDPPGADGPATDGPEGVVPAKDGPEGAVLAGDGPAREGAVGDANGATSAGLDGDEMDQTVYELAEWLPEQKAQLSVLLDDAGVAHEWDDGELVVAASSEEEVEGLFDQVGGADEDDDDESRYQAVAELFAACGRLAGDPSDDQKAALVLEWAAAAEGPPLLGMAEVDWFRIMTRLRSLVAAIQGDEDDGTIRIAASELQDMLRSVV